MKKLVTGVAAVLLAVNLSAGALEANISKDDGRIHGIKAADLDARFMIPITDAKQGLIFACSPLPPEQFRGSLMRVLQIQEGDLVDFQITTYNLFPDNTIVNVIPFSCADITTFPEHHQKILSKTMLK